MIPRMKKLWTAAAAAVCLITFLYAQPRAQKDNGEVLIGGVRRPIVGTVSMDNLTVDVGTGSTTGGSCAAFTQTTRLFTGTLTALATARTDWPSGLTGFYPTGPGATSARADRKSR